MTREGSKTDITALLAAYAAGIGIGSFLLPSAVFAAPPLLLGVLWLILGRRIKSDLLLLLFFVTLGLSLHHLRSAPPLRVDHVRAFVGEQRLALEAEVIETASRPQNGSVLDLEARLIASKGIAAQVHGRVRLYIDKGIPSARAGDVVRFRSRLRETRTYGTPGEFDFPGYMARRGIFATAFLGEASEIVIMERVSDPGFFRAIQRHREVLARFIDSRLPPSEAPLVRALVLGDKSGISPEQRETLGRGGVSHLFAISGLHLGLIAGFLYLAARTLYRRCDTLLAVGPPRRHLPPLLLPLLWAYLLLTGSALPTFRAFAMALAGALLFLSGRRTPPLKLLAATAFLILCFDPLALFQPSFQLSFAGVLGILVLLPPLRGRTENLPGPLRWLVLLFGTTFAASLATAPLVLWHFHLIAPAGLLTNLAAVPAVGFLAVPLGLAGAIAHLFTPEGAALLFQACGFVVESVLRMVEATVAVPSLGGWRLYATPFQQIGFLLLVLALLFAAAPPGRRTGMALSTLGLLLLVLPFPTPHLAVTVLSVGQGDAILLSRSGGRHYLVDGGGLYSDTFDVGERLVAPALGRLGIASLQAVVLTHDDPDHRKGLMHILEHFPVKEFWSPAPTEDLHPTLQSVLQRKNLPVVLRPPGWTVLERTAAETFALFVPPLQDASDNDRSQVIYARQGSEGVLLTGDIESAGVRSLSAAPLPGSVTVLKLPHHGSRHSSPELLFDLLQPRLAFVSAGKGNRYGLPHPSVVTALKRRSTPLYRTDLLGTFRFVSEDGTWQVQKWQKGLFH